MYSNEERVRLKCHDFDSDRRGDWNEWISTFLVEIVPR